MKIFSGSSNPKLVEYICKNLNVPIGQVKLQKFPSGEEHCQFQENIRGTDVFLVQSLSSPVNDNLMQLLLMADAARRASASRITAVIPYFGYCRQDRKDKPRVPISAKVVMDLLPVVGFNRILTMDLHAAQEQGFTNLPMDQLSFRPVLAAALKEPVDCVVAPDIGSVKRADEYATALKAELVIISKKRNSATAVEVKHFIGDVEGKNCLIVDDLTESAGTLVEAATACRENKAKTVRCAVTHGCFTSIGGNRTREAYEHGVVDQFFVSNTVDASRLLPPWITAVDVSNLFATAIKNIHNNESVSELFRL